jgi:hypothetical protein
MEHGRTGEIPRSVIMRYSEMMDELALMVDEVLSKIIEPGMTETQKVKAVYDFLIFQYVHTGESPLPDSPKVDYVKRLAEVNVDDDRLGLAYGLMYGGQGVCDYFAALFAVLLTRMGIQAEIWGGNYVNRDGTRRSHAWNRAYVDGAWRWYDVDVEGTVYRRGGSVLYYLYAKGDTEWATTHDTMTLEDSAESMAQRVALLPPPGAASAASTPAPAATPIPTAAPIPTATPIPAIPAIDSPSTWAAASAANASIYGIAPASLMKGYQRPITRGNAAQMFVNIVEKVSGLDIDSYIALKGLQINGSFTDTNDHATLAANALGIISGVGDGRFNPDGTLTRAQAAIITNRVAVALDRNTTGYSHAFTDVSGHWVDKELGWPVAAGIISGVGEGRFEPESPLTTEQSMIIAVKAYEYLVSH